jgi:hypothetical protein
MITAVPTTVGETNTHPWVSKRQNALDAMTFVGSDAEAGPNEALNIRTQNKNRITPPDDSLCKTYGGRDNYHMIRAKAGTGTVRRSLSRNELRPRGHEQNENGHLAVAVICLIGCGDRI